MRHLLMASLTHEIVARYLVSLACPTDEPTRERLEPIHFEFERRRITLDALRDELCGAGASFTTSFAVFGVLLIGFGSKEGDMRDSSRGASLESIS